MKTKSNLFFFFQGNESAIKTVQEIADLMQPTLKMEVVPGGAGADVEMICENV